MPSLTPSLASAETTMFKKAIAPTQPTGLIAALDSYVNDLRPYAARTHHPAIALPAYAASVASRALSRFAPGGSIHDLMNGQLSDPEEIASAALDAATLAQTGAWPLAPASKGGTLGSIIAPDLRRSADQHVNRLLDRADYTYDALQARVHDAPANSLTPLLDQIWQEHRVYPWFDKKGTRRLLGELPDTADTLRLQPDVQARLASNKTHLGTLGTTIDHPALFIEDPRQASITTRLRLRPEQQGGYTPYARLIRAQGPDPEQTLSSLLHEMTHAQQHEMGLPMGYSTTQARHRLTTPPVDSLQQHLTGRMRERYQEDPATAVQHLYEMEPGESQARMTQMRRYGSPSYLSTTSPLTTMTNHDIDPRRLLWGLE